MNRIKPLLAAGEATFGAIVTMPSVQVVHALASAGLDWILIDMEHGPIDLDAAHALIAATGGTNVVPLVRIPWTSVWHPKAVLDLGVMGVCFPMVNDAETARAAVRAVRYPPDGDRMWGPFYASMRWGRSIPEYMAEANAAMMAIATIEHPDAVANIAEIAAVPGLDLAFIGPGDLATAMGIAGQFDHPQFVEAVSRAEAGLVGSGVALGGVARTADQAKAMLDRGYRALVIGFDWGLLQQSATNLLAQIDAVRR